MYKLAVFIGRFQPFHNGHLVMAKHALEQADKLLFLIGSAYSARNVKNPFLPSEREQMIRASMPGANICFEYLHDFPYDDDKWFFQVRTIVSRHCDSDKDIMLVGSKKDKSSYYLDQFEGWHQSLEKKPALSSQDLRLIMFNEDHGLDDIKQYVPDGVFSFLSHFNKKPLIAEASHILAAKHAGFFKPSVTADALVTHNGHVLLIKRTSHYGFKQMAMPGGFLEENETIYDCAVRELKEETGIYNSFEDLKKSFIRVNAYDEPGRSQRGRVITHCHHFNLENPQLSKAQNEETFGSSFYSLEDVDKFYLNHEMFSDHYHIIKDMLEFM